MTSGERRTGRLLASLLGAALVASLLAVATPARPAKAVGETLVTPAATRIVPSSSNAALSDDFNIAGYQSGDTLLTNVSLSGPSGTTFSIPTTTGLTLGFGYSSWTGRTDLSFTGNQANTNAALDSMTVSTGATSGTAILTVSTTLSTANTYYYSATGHFYQAVSSSGITWTNANTAATGASYKGRPGYLVTITSPEEQNFLNNNVSGNNIWIGLTDKDCEGTWKWQGGPEAGQTAFQATSNTNCNNTTSSYSSVGTSLMYTNWCSGQTASTGEPNNSDGATGEDMAVTKWSGGTCWNDLRDGNSSNVSGYVIEYGDTQAFTDFLSGNMTIAVSTTPGTIASVTSDLLNGTYGRGQNIDIKVNFTDPVNVTGSPTLTLDPTGNDNGAVATYLSGSGTSTLVFRYTVLEGHSESDLNYTSTSALSLNGGTITLVSGGANATLTLPATSASESLGGSKNIVISTTTDAPSSSITAASLAAYTTSASVSIPYTASDPSTTIRSVTAFYSTSSSLTSPQQCGTTTSATSPNTVTCTLPATNTTYYLYTRATDAAGVQEAAPGSWDDTIILDTVAPAFNTLSASPNPVIAASGQAATVTFTLNESVTTFSAADVSVTYGTLSGFSGSGSSYTATFTPTRSSSGPAVLTIAAGGVTDAAGNSNVLATLTISITATNGRTTYTSGGTNYIVERFSTTGSNSWRAPNGVTTIDYLLVGGGGGGGGGGYSNSWSGNGGGGGGGGAGAVASGTATVTPGSTYTLTVGAGGGGGSGGSNSTWNGTTGSGGATSSAFGVSASGGSGGCGAGWNASTTSCTTSTWTDGSGGFGGVSGSGQSGGSRTPQAEGGGGGGGGGSNSAGSSPTGTSGGGGGGGTSSSITGSATIYATGGVGGTGTGGGIAGTTNVSVGGGGGGGAGESGQSTGGAGATGSNGIAVVSYSLPSITVPDLDDASDLGSTTDNRTSDTTPTFSGSAPVGAAVQLYANGVATGSVCYANDTTGIWQCTTATLATGIYSFTAVATTTLETTSVTSTSSALSVTIETTLPTITAFSSSNADGSYGVGQLINITATASETVLAGSSFVATLNITPSRTVTLTAATQGTTLTGSYTVQATDTSADLTVSSFTAGTVTDTAGNLMTSTTVPTGTNNIAGVSAIVIDTTAPTLSLTSVNAAGTKVILTYNEALSTTTAATTAFTVVNNGYPNPVTAVAVSGSTIELTLTETIPQRQTVTVTYTDPTASNDSAAIQDLSGNDAASRSSATAVTNSSTATIPLAARLIGLNTETVVTLSGVTGGIRGITGDGTNVYFRIAPQYNKIYSVPISSIASGTTATATPTSWDIIDATTNSTAVLPAYEQTQLAYSSGCIFFMTADDANSLKCVDTTTRRMTSVAFPGDVTPPAGRIWLLSDLVSFPDGRIGKLRQLTGSGTSYSSDLVMYNVVRSGGTTTLTYSETMTLSDIEAFPGDDHGFATDGVYGYRLNHANTAYKVWRLQSGSPSNVIFDGDASTGTCDADLGGRCNIALTGITNATFMGYDPGSNRYFVGDYGSSKFYMTEAANPGVGPGTAPITVSSFTSAVTSPTTSPSPAFTLTFNAAVTGVTSADFSNTGSATCTFAVTAVSTTVYTVTPTCDDGTVRPQFAANGAILASNGTSTGPAFANSASTTVTVGIPPTVIAFSSTTADGSYRATQTINITATMSEAIRSGNSFVVTLNTGATVTLTAASAGTTLTGTYTVVASQTTADLTVSSFTVGTVLDTAGNAMTSTSLPTGANIANTSNIAVDTTSPSVVSFTSAASTPTNASSITYTITFSEAVTGIESGDFSNTGTAGNCVFDPGTDTSSTLRTVTITGCGAGTIIPRFAINGAADGVGNAGPSSASTSGTTITRDITSPTISSFSSTTADGNYTTGQSINITATASESIRSGSTITVTLDTGATVTLTAGSAGLTMTGTYTIAAGQNSADLDVSSYAYSAGAVLDTAGNAMTSTAVPTGANSIAGVDAIVVDTTGPAAPTGLSATANLNSVTISFTPGVGGPSAVTNYKYSLNGGAFTAFSPADSSSPVTITGLTTGTSYTIALRTVTAIGDSASSSTVTVTPSNITGLSTVSYTEQAAAASIASAINLSGGSSYDGKYIDFAIGSAQATEILGYTTSGTASITNGTVSIVGTSVYLGNGTTADPIGSIDSTRNGQNGQPLRINFTSSFSNNSFETGDLTGWTYLDQQIRLNETSIANYTTVDNSTYPNRCGNDSNDDAVTSVPASAFGNEIITSTIGGSPGVTDGTRALRLFSTMSASPAGYVIHGPAIYSDVFPAAAGDTIYFDWRAANGDDNYHVYGYILNTATGVQTEVLDSTGTSTPWATKATTISASGNYRFVFVSGTHDYSCGGAGGASLYIDNVRVFGNKVNDSVATKVAQLVTYRNTSDAPATSRTVTVSTNPTGGTFTTTFAIAVTAVDDSPSLTAVSSTYTNTSANDTFTAASGTLPGSDPDGDTLTYSLPGGSTGSATYSSVTYDRFQTGTYGTLWLRSSTGQYYFAPDNTAINNRLTNDSESFATRVTASGVTADSTLSVSVSITAAAPAAPTALVVTPGVRALEVSWTAPTWIGGSAVTGYRIEHSTNGSTWTTASDNSSTTTSLRIASLADATAYHVRVAAKNVNGTSIYLTSSPTTYSTFDKPTALTLTPVGGTVVANTLNSTNTNLTAQATIVAGRLTGGTATLYRGSTALATDTSIGVSDTTVTFDMGASTTAELQGLIATGGSITVKVVDSNGLETLASTAVTLAVDYTRPTVGITRAGSGVLNQGTSDTITFTLSESSSNFVSSDVTVSGGTLSALSGSGTSYTGTFTVSSGATGSATLSVLGSAFTDAAGNGNSASSTLTISLNSAPTLGTPTTASYTDTIASDTFAATTGTLVGADTDSGDTLTYGITSGTDGGTTVSRTGTYGTLTVTKATGAYSFTPNNSAINIRAANASETYTVTVTDGIQTTTATFTVSITAANDAPVMTQNVASTASFTDSAANDAFTVQTGTFAATDVESNTISSWSMTGATTVSDLLAWTSGSITFTRKLVGTYGTLYVEASTGKYRFEPNNAAINGLVSGTSEIFPVTVTDSLSATGSGTYTVSMTAVNDRPIATVTVSNIADVTTGLPTSAYSLYHTTAGTGSTPAGEQVYRAFDDATNTKYLNFSGAGSGVNIDLGAGNAYAVNGLGLTTANDEQARDPASYAIYGSSNGSTYSLISSGALAPPTARQTAYPDITFTNTTSYRYYRVVFPAIRGGGADSYLQISEIRLPAKSGQELNYTEGAAAGVVLSGIDVADPDTATLTGATVSITSYLTTGDVLGFTNDGSTMGSIAVDSYDATTGVLTLTGNATPTQYQNAFRAVTFRNTSNNPTSTAATRTITWQVNDGQTSNNLSTAVTSTITIVETVPTISSVAITSSAGTDSRYAIGETVEVSATFTEAVTVTGSPRMAVNGLSGKYFTYSAGSGTPTLVFSYTVASGDSAASGVGVVANALALNGGTIKDSVAAAVTITHSAVSLSSSHIVDGVLPVITAFTSSSANGSYMAGGAITISATTSETVQANGSIDVTLDTGAVVTLTNASAGTTLMGTYTVGANENSSDLTVSSFGITSVLDVAGNAMTSTTVPTDSSNIAGANAIVVDTTAPTISQMSVSADGSYKAGQSLTITATANEAVRSGNTITVTFDTGETLTLTAATAGTTFSGTYTVAAGVNSSDLTVSSFTIGTVLDTAGNAMTSTTIPTGANAIGSGTAVIVDTTAPTITSFTTTTANGSYKAGQTINITATVSEPVQAGNTVSVTLNSGATVTLSTPADTQSWSATVGGVTCGPYTRRTVTGSLTGGTVWGSGPYTDDSNFNRAAVHAGLVAVGQTAVIEPYNIVRISSYTGSTQNGVTTTGYSSPWCGYSIRLATGVSATSTTLTGTYTIAAGQTAAMLNVNTFSIGTVADGAGNAMTSTTVPGGSNIADTSSLAIDTTAPTITSFSSTTADGAYRAGQTINITATAAEPVRSGNTITATLNTGRSVVLTASSAGVTFSGTYTVIAGDTASDLTVSSFTIGAVLDTAGNTMTSTSMPVGANSFDGAQAIVVDTTSPTVQSFASTQTSPTSSTTFTYTLTFSEAVVGITDGDFENTGTATCTFDPGTDTSATTRTVAVTCTTKGTVTPRFLAAEAADAAGNTGPSTNNTSATSITVNNAPTLATPTTATFTDTSAADTFVTVADSLVGADVDPGDVVTYSISGGTDNSTTVTKAGTYGVLTVTKATGEYTYVPDATVINARTANASETFTVSATDGIQTTTAVFTVSVVAVNDLPIITSTSFGYTDTAAKDTFTIQLGQFTATDAETNSITSWDITGGTVLSPASPLPWTSGNINFDRVFTNSFGSLYLQSSSGRYRYEPNSITLNALTLAGSAGYPVTATDSAGSVGTLTVVASATAVNDNPIATVTVGTLADVTDGLPTSAYAIYHPTSPGGGSSPPTEQVWRAFDNLTSTKYLNFAGAGSGVTIDLGAGNAKAVTGLGLTTANDSPNRNPTSYAVYGSADNAAFTLISSGSITPPNAYFADYPAITFPNTTSYRYYRVTFPTIAGATMVQISEIRLPSLLGEELTYLENAAAGRVLAGISVEDGDTATLTGATVSITAGLTTGDELSLTNDAATMGPVSGTYDPSTGVLTLTGAGTPAQYQAAFRAVTFRNSTNNPTNPTLGAPTRTVTWRVDDGQTVNNLSGAPTSTITVTETYATVSSITFSSTSGSDSLYGIGDTVNVTATFSEVVNVTGTPRIPLSGLTSKYASYVSGSGTSALTFAYTVVSGDSAAGGLSLATNALSLNGGTIKDTANLSATITHNQVSASNAQAVDGVTPVLSGMSSALASPTNLTTLTYTMTFSESVTGVAGDDFSNDGSATDCVFDPGTDSGSTRTLTVTSCSGGTVIPVFAGTGASDAAGNPTAASAVASTSTITRRHVRTISFATTAFAKTYGDTTFDVSATASRGVGDGSVTYAVGGGPCTVGSSSGTVTITGAGTCTISATVAQGTFHMTATTTTDVTVTIAKKALTITASSHAVTYGDSAPTITPSYSAFAYNESATDLTTAPTCTTAYTATSTAQIDVPTTCATAASNNYAFTYVAGAITIAKQPISVTFDTATLSQVFNGGPRVVTATTSVTGRKLVFSFTPLDFDGPTVTTPPTNAGRYSIIATVTETNYVGSAFSTLLVDKAEQTALKFGNATTVTYGSKLQLVAIGGSGSGALTYRVRSGKCAVSATGSLSNTGAGSCVVRMTKAASANHLVASSDDLTVTVTKQDQTLEWVSMLPSSPIAGSSYIPGVKASSDLTAIISITTGENVSCAMKQGVVTFLNKGECTLSARQPGNLNYNAAARITQTISVGNLNQTITFPQPDEHRIGDSAFELGASSSSGLAVSYSATGLACTVSSAGVVTIVAPGTCDITVTQAGDNVYTPASPVTKTLVVRAGLPGVPHLMSAAPADGIVVASYSTPPTDGGSPILAYVVTATPPTGDATSRSDCSTTTLTCTIVGLVNGTAYRIKVAAVTEAGVGDFSDESEAVTPFAAPEAVKDLVGTRQDEKLLVTWDDPESLGGGTLVRYDLSLREKGGDFGAPVAVNTASLGGVRLMAASGTSRGHTFTGLRKGTTYELKVVTVTNLSSASTSTNTAQAVVQRMNVADAPRNLDIEATSETSAVVTWATPLRDGGSPITSYVTTSTNGTCTPATPTAQSCIMTGLTAGKNVTVTVKAQTKVGASEAASATISLPGKPGAPTIASVTRSGTSATVTWTAPASDGGRAITSYRIKAISTLDAKDSLLCSSTSLTCTVQGLAMSSAYNFTAKAYNTVGEGSTSATFFSQAFSAVPAVWGAVSDRSGERVLAGLPPAPGRVKVLASGSKSNVTATAPKTSIPITHAIITVAGTKGRVLLRLKVAVDKSNPETSVTIPYSSSKIKVAVQFANAFGVSPMATTGWKPTPTVLRQTDAAANVMRGVTAVRMVPVGKVIGEPVYFIGASSALSATGKRALASIAAEAKREGGIINVTGYARKSPTTSNAFIKKVSEQRALVVANYLATLGVQQWVRWQGVGAPTTTTGSDTDRRVVVSLSPYEQ